MIKIVKFDVFQRYSSLNRLFRLTAYCLPFIFNLHYPNHKITGNISTYELEQSLRKLIKLVQAEDFFCERLNNCYEREKYYRSIISYYEYEDLRIDIIKIYMLNKAQFWPVCIMFLVHRRLTYCSQYFV